MLNLISFLIVLVSIGRAFSFDVPFSEGVSKNDNWQGKWFPQPPNKAVDDNPEVEYPKSSLHDSKHGIVMGVATKHCDDAKTNITLDWDDSPVNFTCFEDKHHYLPRADISPELYCDRIPRAYQALHECMDTKITYNEQIPTFGTHRPLWAKYGEYQFVPPQRWIHNLEHGALVMLYHPCANKHEVKLLKKLVTSCLYRHIITPYTLLQPERPLALVTWGCRMVMSKVDPQIVMDFIRSSSLKGPEKNSVDGQYDHALIKNAQIVSDQDDSELCPIRS